jgi:co-chaperonin GroES (HSP10)
MTTVRPINNNVLFQFIEETSGSRGNFIERQLASGIIIPVLPSKQKVHRWGKAIAVGPKAEVQVGDYILVESLMWMEGTEVDGVKMWKTDDSKILAITNDLNDCYAQ